MLPLHKLALSLLLLVDRSWTVSRTKLQEFAMADVNFYCYVFVNL